MSHVYILCIYILCMYLMSLKESSEVQSASTILTKLRN